jgi:hypothetical protein
MSFFSDRFRRFVSVFRCYKPQYWKNNWNDSRGATSAITYLNPTRLEGVHLIAW